MNRKKIIFKNLKKKLFKNFFWFSKNFAFLKKSQKKSRLSPSSLWCLGIALIARAILTTAFPQSVHPSIWDWIHLNLAFNWDIKSVMYLVDLQLVNLKFRQCPEYFFKLGIFKKIQKTISNLHLKIGRYQLIWKF